MCRYLTCADAAALVPGNPTWQTVWRWARKGVKSRDGSGRRIHLEHIVVGTRILIPEGAIDGFIKAVTAADVDHFEKKAEAAITDNVMKSYRLPKASPRAAIDIQETLKRFKVK